MLKFSSPTLYDNNIHILAGKVSTDATNIVNIEYVWTFEKLNAQS